MMLRKLGVVTASFAMLLGVAACSATPPGGTPTTTDPAAPTTNTETATPTDAAPQTIDTVGLMVQDLSNPFFLVMKNAMEAQGQADGFTVNTQDGQQDLGQQNSQIDAYIAQKIDLLLINAVDSQGIGTAVQRALDAGIVVVAVDVDAAGSQAVVMTNNVEAGTLSCTALADKLGGSGNVAIIDGTPITSVQDRIKGCEEVLASEYPGITVVAKQSGKNDVASGQTIATDMLTAHPEIQGIFALNDPTARGAVLALQQAQRTDIWVTGVDGSPDAVTEMNQPNSPFWATPAQDPAGMVVKAYEVGRDIIANGPPAEADRVTLMAPSLVTQDNLADYKGWQV